MQVREAHTDKVAFGKSPEGGEGASPADAQGKEDFRKRNSSKALVCLRTAKWWPV